MLFFDRPTNKLKGAIEYIFDQQTDSFNVEILSESFENFSAVSLIYRELNDTLFSGTRIPGGIGNMTYPETK
jgi:stress-induced morphogen